MIHQVYRMAEFDRVNNGITWWTGVCTQNTRRANNVWRIFMRYQRNIEIHFNRPKIPCAFNLTKDMVLAKLPRSVYAGY